MQNPYDVLGVSKSASAKDIKAAYRKLTRSITRTRIRTMPRRRTVLRR